eukprot:403369366
MGSQKMITHFSREGCFNWPEQLYKQVSENSQNFNQNKFRSAIFYLNYSARQMRGMSVDLDSQIGRKFTLMRKKLQKLDKYPSSQNFLVESQVSSSKSPNSGTKKGEELKTEGDYIETEKFTATKKSKKNPKDSEMMTNLKKTENSMLSMIYQDIHKIKNIEDFNAPLSNIDKVLQSLLYQMRANLNEPDHPINIIVRSFSDIILRNVNEKRNQLQRTSKINYNQQPLYEIDFDRNKMKSIKLSTARLKKNIRATYDRQTLQQLPKEVQYAEIVLAEVKKLICILYGTLIRFYIPVMRFEDLHEMREDLIELLTSLTVRGDLSKLLLQLCKLVTNEEEIILTSKFQDLKNVRPEDIGINKLFTLNESSYLMELFEKQEQEMQQEFGDIEGSSFDEFEKSPSEPRFGNSEKTTQVTAKSNPLIMKDEENEVLHRSKSCIIRETVSRRVTQEQNFNRNKEPDIEVKIPFAKFEAQALTISLINQRIQQKPYQQAFQNLRRLRELETPIDKMRCITQTSKHIVQCIDTFWKEISQVNKKKLTLDADELLMIFIYVTLRSKISEFYGHLKLINEFSTDTLRQSKLGYYTSTMEVALSQVLTLNKQMLMQKSFKQTVLGQAQDLIEDNIKSSCASEYPIQIVEQFDFLDQYDKNMMDVLKSDNQMEFNKMEQSHYLDQESKQLQL